MKHVKRLGFMALLLKMVAFAPLAFALEYTEPQYETYWGLNAKQTFAKAAGDWQSVFKRNQTGMDAYVGGLINPYLALEVGYEVGFYQTSKISLSSGQTFLGQVNGGNSLTLTGRLHLKSFHADLNALIPLKEASFF